MLLEQEKVQYFEARKEMIKEIEEKTDRYWPWHVIGTAEVEKIYCEVGCEVSSEIGGEVSGEVNG